MLKMMIAVLLCMFCTFEITLLTSPFLILCLSLFSFYLCLYMSLSLSLSLLVFEEKITVVAAQ